MAQVTVRTNGQTLVVSASVAHWTSAALAVVASGDDDVAANTATTITADYAMHFPNTATTATITVYQLDGTTLLSQTLEVNPGVGARVLNPAPDPFMVAADGSPAAIYGGLNRPNVTMRLEDTGTAVSTTTGNMRLVTFVGQRTETATKVRFITGGTAAAATPTLVRVGLFTVDSAGAGTLVASTANDTALASSTNTAYSKAFSASYGMVKGGLYALGILVVSAGQCPTLVGKNDIAGGTETTEAALLPRLCGTLGSQTDLPASYTNAGLSASASVWYGCVSA